MFAALFQGQNDDNIQAPGFAAAAADPPAAEAPAPPNDGDPLPPGPRRRGRTKGHEVSESTRVKMRLAWAQQKDEGLATR